MKCTKTGPRLLLFWAIYFGQTQADLATLYEVSTSATGPATLTSSIEVIQSGTTNVRAIGTTNVRAIGTGTGADGKPETTYVQDNIVSLYVAKFPSPDDPSKTATTTLISGPQTIAVTFAENQNGYHATRSLSIVSPTHSATGTGTGTGTGGPLDFQGGLDEKCVFYANGTGSCVRIDIGLDSATRTTFSTRTYTGTLAPWYTAGKDDVRAATGSQSQTTKPTSNGGGSVRLGRGGRFLGGGSGLGMLGVVMGVGLSAGLGMLGCVV